MGARRLPAIVQSARLAAPIRRRLPDGTLADEPVTRSVSMQARVPRLADMLAPDQNSFGVMRLLLALAVVVSHAVYLTTGRVEAEPLFTWTGYTLGQHGVQGFFVLSGILVAQSLARSRSLAEFATARALRIFPALVVCVLGTALVLGPWLTSRSLGGYLSDPAVLTYIAKTITLVSGSAPLPSVFATNTVADVVNSSVWTLKYEVLCYVILGVVGWVVLRSGQTRWAAIGVLAVWGAIVLALPVGIELTDGVKPAWDVLRYFTLFFGVGVAFFLARTWLPVSIVGVVVSGALLWVANGTRFEEPAMALALGYALVWLATFRFGSLRDVTNRSDYSYGIYLWHMPLAQGVLVFVPELGPLALTAATIAVTLPLAVLSWRLVERPALALRHRLFPKPAGSATTCAAVAAASEAAAPSHGEGPCVPPTPAVTSDRLARATQIRRPGRLQPGQAPIPITRILAKATTPARREPGRELIVVPTGR